MSNTRRSKKQYLMDNDGLAGKRDKKWRDALDDGVDTRLHTETMHDENERNVDGALYDEATGRAYRNDRPVPSGLVHRVVRVKNVNDSGPTDVLGTIYDANDDVDVLLNKPADELTQEDIDAMMAVYEEKQASMRRHPSSHKSQNIA